jgi:hypothetical protein
MLKYLHVIRMFIQKRLMCGLFRPVMTMLFLGRWFG